MEAFLLHSVRDLDVLLQLGLVSELRRAFLGCVTLYEEAVVSALTSRLVFEPQLDEPR